MFGYVLFVLSVAALVSSQVQQPEQDIDALLARSEALYYEARFKESVDLLAGLDESFQSEAGRSQDKIRLKFQLALGNLALNDIAKAKSYFVEVCVLDPKCSIDPAKYSPKVLNLFEEAKASVNVESTGGQSYQEGLDAYKKGDLANAAQKFRGALLENSEDVVAAQYLRLAEDKLRLVIEQKLLNWRRNFAAGQMGLAAASYRELLSLNVENMADTAIDQIQMEYRKELTQLIEAWNRACKNGDAIDMNRLRSRAADMLPAPAIGEDLLNQMTMCASKACVSLDVQAAMLRVKTSRKPEVPPAQQKALQNIMGSTVRVQARIDEDGNVSVLAARGENPAINDAVRSAVEKWKFFPAIFENEPRCVETVFPIVLTPSSPN